MSPESTRQTVSEPKTRLRCERKFATRSTRPIGKNTAKPSNLARSAAICAAVVLTVRTDIFEPLATVSGLSEHVGKGVPPPVTLQERLTLAAKPFKGTIVTVDVADPPAEIRVGENAEAEIWKSGPWGPWTTKGMFCECVSVPAVPTTATV